MAQIAEYSVGNVTVFCLEDGSKVFSSDVFAATPVDRQRRLLTAAGLAEIATAFNAYALRYPDGRVTLVDTGCGAFFGPAGGRLRDGLDQLNISAEAVERIVFTHLHTDHCGGAMRDGAPVFPGAQIVLHAAEAAYWRGKDSAGGALLSASDRITLVEAHDRLDDLLQVWALPGHTPGHMGLRIGADLVLVGDVVHSEALQLPDPQNRTIYDVDAAMAQESRIAALGQVADQGLIWSGSHMLGPDKFARLERDGAGYRRVDRGSA